MCMESRGEPVTGGRKDLAHRGVWDRESISKSVHSWDFPLKSISENAISASWVIVS